MAVALQNSKYETRELSAKTWPDFVKLFTQGNGWDHCWCVHFHRACAVPKDKWLATRAERGVRNRRMQKSLLDRGCSHGILVYVEGEPVGWCQYGLKEELPRIDSNRNYRGIAAAENAEKVWRITCFVVDRKFRRRGIAGAALRAALKSIATKGGGLVEAFPVENWEGKAFGNMSTNGTVSMFKKEGFKIVAPFGNTNVVMRRTI
jgi:GNAT superfamily N-acetyltransferase